MGSCQKVLYLIYLKFLRHLLGDFKFLDKLMEFNVLKVDEKRFFKLRTFYMSNPDFNLKNILKVSSAAS
jgi:hypothetical protein